MNGRRNTVVDLSTEAVDLRIGILGSGLIGGKLGTIFAHAGHEVVFSYSRSQRKLKRLGSMFIAFRGLQAQIASSARS